MFRSEADHPAWVTKNFARGQTVLRVDEVASMAAAVRNHVGIAKLPCYMGDFDAGLRRLDVPLAPSHWGIWILSHVDLRTTARVRACREFLLETIERQRPLIHGEKSRYV